ncbi:LOW QUALITY PROTEIN: hypothetical protein OSB04_002491 [Centaurea solstitialis]|uniref:CCHC-type domain-containing protein n=1 Tax=Centaurea solstitialis TaxID=347529 RepID=A0AA38WT87_9ASTR|nr:LOW QUALITY PROTEIN: hypothetical protein OSB04_002491 [Centaurea solstitialis]
MASTVTSTNNLSLRSILEKDKLTSSNFLDWERNLMIVLRHERKWYVLEEPLGEAPPANAPAAARNAHKKHSDDLLDVACLMLATMSPDLQAGLINTNAYDMIRQLRDMFQTQARTERYDATKAFNECKMVKGTSVSDHVMKMKRHLDHLERLGHPVPLQLATDTILNSLSEDYRPFVVNYNMNNMEKTIAELHSMLKTAELNMGNKNKTKDVLMVKDGGVKKKNGHASTSKGKGPVQAIQSAPKKGKGKGKGKKVKPNKARTENRCFICNEIGHWRQNCPKRHEAGSYDQLQNNSYKRCRLKVAQIFDRVANIGRDPRLRLLLGIKLSKKFTCQKQKKTTPVTHKNLASEEWYEAAKATIQFFRQVVKMQLRTKRKSATLRSNALVLSIKIAKDSYGFQRREDPSDERDEGLDVSNEIRFESVKESIPTSSSISLLTQETRAYVSRPNIMYATCLCARYQDEPKESHLTTVNGYLKGAPNLGLWYSKDSGFDLIAYSDSDFAGCKLDRKSTTGGCQLLGGKLVSWTSKKQNSVSTSTAEAEYVAAGRCCVQVPWMRNQLQDYDIKLSKILIYCDNTSAIAIANNPVLHSKTKHIEVRYHFIRDHVMNGDIEFHFVPTEYQLADLLTKPLDYLQNVAQSPDPDDSLQMASSSNISTKTHNTEEPMQTSAAITDFPVVFEVHKIDWKPNNYRTLQPA